MSEHAALLEACRLAPDDDGPRLVWADAIGGERGELVVLQCDLARGELAPAELAARRRRCDELLARHGAAWSGLAALAKRCLFRRGFVETVELPLATFLARWEDVLAAAPLLLTLRAIGLASEIDVRDSDQRVGPIAEALVGALLEHPALARLRGLELTDARVVHITGDTEWHYNPIGLAELLAERITASGKLAGLRAFAIGEHGDLTNRGFHELVGSNVLPSLERLTLHGTPELRPAVVQAVLDAAPRLRALDLRWYQPLAGIAHAMPATVVELAVSSIDAAQLAALARSPAAASLERLAIAGARIHALADVGAFRNLRALDLGTWSVADHDIPPAAVEELAARGLPALRELAIGGRLGEATAVAIAEAFGSQLARLDCRRATFSPVTIAALRDRVAGEVVLGQEPPGRLLDAAIRPREPWLDYGLVTLAS